MPTVVIPAILRPLTAGAREVPAAGSTLRAVIEDVERQHPGLKGRVLENGSLRPELFLAIGNVEAFGLDVPVEPDAEVFILPAIAGGSDEHQHKPGQSRLAPVGSHQTSAARIQSGQR